jgi:hypothetical protein
MPAPRLCVECHERPKYGRRQRCLVCYTRSEGITERVDASRRRLAAVPAELYLRTVPERLWPPRTRWCAGCQSFVDLEDVPTNGSRCRSCVSATTHASRIEKVFGIDAAEYERILALQGGKCAICRSRPKKKRLAVDHNHKTGAVRGLLCGRCNHELLGAGWDSRNVLIAAVNYLDTPPASGHWRPPESLDPDGETAGFAEPETPAWAGGTATEPRAESRTGIPSRMTIDELMLVGGSRDERGVYRIYYREGEPPPF